MKAMESPELAFKRSAEVLEVDPTNALCASVCSSARHCLMGSINFQVGMVAPYFDIPMNRQDGQSRSQILAVLRPTSKARPDWRTFTHHVAVSPSLLTLAGPSTQMSESDTNIPCDLAASDLAFSIKFTEQVRHTKPADEA